MSKTTQNYHDPELGTVQFFDKNEKTSSAKCRVHDIQLIERYDRDVSKRLKRDIADDINGGRS